MKLTLREIIQENGLVLENTVYKTMPSSMLDYPIAAEKAAFSANNAPVDGGFGLLWDKRVAEQQFMQSKEYCTLNEKAQALKQEVKKENLEALLLRKLRTQKNEIECQLKEILQQEKVRLSQTMFNVACAEQNAILMYKNFVYAANPVELAQRIPALADLHDDLLDGGVYTKNIENFAKAAQTAKQIGIEGGPCLFGAWEVQIHIEIYDGQIAQFDFTTGVAFTKESFNAFPYEDVQDFIVDYADKIKKVKFYLYKNSLTTQEIAAMEYVMRVAKVFNANAYIPLPDMSYIKYLNSILSPIKNEKVRNDAIYCFRELAYSQTDLFLEQAQILRVKYPSVPLFVTHERETEMMKTYMKNRKQFLDKNATKAHRLTKRFAWLESINDYITMPSLPYYLHGITDIIVADTLDEVDSTRKCVKLHNNVLNIQALFFAEPIGPNNLQSMFYSPREYKQYLKGVLLQPKEFSV